MWTQLIHLVARVLPIMTMAMAAPPNHPLLVIQDRTPPVAIRDITDKLVDLRDWFNNPWAWNLTDNILQNMSTHPTRRSGVKLAWMPWGNVPGPVKPRATVPHANTDPVIRASIDVHVNTPSWCRGVDGSVIYYIFPDNTDYLIDGIVDGWDTLTDDLSACSSDVNDQLRKDMPKLIPIVQHDLIHPVFYSFYLGEHFGSYYLLPQWTGRVVDNADVQLVLQRDTIVSRWNNLCMAVQGASYTSGALVQQAACNNGPEQKYDKIYVYPPRIFWIMNHHSRMCLGISEGSTANGALIAQYPCDSSDKNQQWESVDPRVGNEVGAKWLINLQSGKCVDVPAWSTTPGTLLQQLDCIGGWKDYWYNV